MLKCTQKIKLSYIMVKMYHTTIHHNMIGIQYRGKLLVQRVNGKQRMNHQLGQKKIIF